MGRLPSTRCGVAGYALGALVVLGGCEGSGGLIQGVGNLQVSRDRIDFGRVFVGLAPTERVTVLNQGNATFTFESAFTGDTEGFAFGPTTAQLPPNGSVELQVLFRPRRAGERNAQIVLTSNAAGVSSAVIELNATGVDVPDCEDGNGCTVDTFELETGRCIHRAEPLPCNDFNACTSNDTCVDGICLGESVSCDDGDACTDDACDPEAGCINIPTGRCDDGNNCTLDLCATDGRCRHENLSDGTPCDDGIVCTKVSGCFNGRCVTVEPFEEGEACNDNDPCTDAVCISLQCIDPNRPPTPLGGTVFTTTVSALARGAGENIIVDRDDTAYVGTDLGITAIDECGEPLWVNDTLGEPRFSAAVSLPGLLSVPIGGRIYDIDAISGEVFRSLDLREGLSAGTASTATVTIDILDLAARNNGALVAGVIRTVTTSVGVQVDGLLAETNALHTIALPMRVLGNQYPTRVTVDADESVVTILRRGDASDAVGDERVLRLGIDGVPGGTWSSSEFSAVRSEVALGRDGEVLWAAGLTSIDRQGTPQPLLPAPSDPLRIQAGSPVTFDDLIFVLVDAFQDRPEPHLLEFNADGLVRAIELPGPTIQHSPAVDNVGRVYMVTADGNLVITSTQTTDLLTREIPMLATPVEGVALTLTSRGNLLIAAGDRLHAIRGAGVLANSSWPRHRRDNLATSNR